MKKNHQEARLNASILLFPLFFILSCSNQRRAENAARAGRGLSDIACAVVEESGTKDEKLIKLCQEQKKLAEEFDKARCREILPSVSSAVSPLNP